jgi:thiamine biosynthesis lipoprotein
MPQSSKSSQKQKNNQTVFPRFRFEAIGTLWHITIEQPMPAEAAEKLFAAIQRRIETFDKTYSRFRTDSTIAAISVKAGSFSLPSDASPLIELYEKLYRITGGVITPLIGGALSDAGYDATYRLSPTEIRATPRWEETISFSNGVLTTSAPVILDFGAAGKGYLADLIGAVIEEVGVSEYCIDAGGDFVCHSQLGKVYEIGLEHPTNPQQAIGIAKINNQSICGSATNRRQWGDFNHLLHPETNTSPRGIIAAWAIAQNGLLADGISAALFFTPADILAKHFDFEYALVYSDFSLEKSRHFPGKFFTTQESM